MTEMSVSDFLLYCAECIEAECRIPIQPTPRGWAEYIVLTLPDVSDSWDTYPLIETRVLRFMLAAAIAKSEGR